MARAQELIRPHAGKQPITVHVADGVYYLPETLIFTPADSGSVDNPIHFKAENEGGAVLSGGSKLDLSWKPYQGFSADAFSKKRAVRWADPAGGYIHAMHRASWGGYHYLITGKDAKGEVAYEGGWQNNRKYIDEPTDLSGRLSRCAVV
ncbi:MAG: hypothetical protein ABF322_04125 [Lentimonas sp.]